ncbi:TRAP transporter substrate-binding protein DctP [Phaeobacter gallaeciensis]|uniref:TRAP transporter substrate-binding protein DctP n=2 Tax=Phaeobacter gallaeciensis TaxID=60890 RepID=UPI00237FA70F|nr:TRAP transporter substrate-binding protein DctP [Phaeobacter gallaeciensis]MDE4305917.1 TRAP transporter substrate-binding protein DctP [Phaeobacter gallaeciensis]MDE4310266.1 TRAP transporter substrate-binding protein DctP [Phaeobacter gallaeciensis]MDE4328417.1 TRAP transporter substrate-binding protein DctP [Phaeobacter gallaeciensis]MDE4332580.1 TRAP transporter substrate-binding protein DctP [Phaeobacter gallaeciensis]MDE4337158.1 TRAP transporter substrate-binding protein DctP [Phaeob
MSMKTILGAAAVGALVTAAAVQAETVTFGTFMPANHPINSEAVVPFYERMGEATGGEVSLDLQPGSVITGTKTTLEGIESGLVTAGYVVDLYIPSSLPYSVAVTNLGMASASPLAGSAAVTEMHMLNCPGCQTEMEDYNTKTFAVQRITDYIMYCREGIETTADMKGKNIKVSSNWGLIVEKLGANPVNVQASEMYEAFQRGLIDCAIAPEIWLEQRSLWDDAKVVFDLPLGAFQGGHLMATNADFYADLDDATKEAWIANMPKLITDVTAAYIGGDKSARKNGMESHGVKYVQPDEAFLNILAEARAENEALTIQRATDAGVENPEALVAKFKELIAKWEGIEAEVGGDMIAFQARLKEEIYDKLPQ